MPMLFARPPLSLSTAHILNVAFTAGYVFPLYLTKYTRPSSSVSTSGGPPRERWRDIPSVIRARMASVALSTIAICLYVHFLIASFDQVMKSEASSWTWSFSRLGFQFHWYLLWPCLVTPALYFGPLYVRFLGRELPFMNQWTIRHHFVDTFFNWQGIRNYVVGPVSEELVWRSCILCVYHFAGASRNTLIFLTPISFGSAHLHHGWEVYTQHGRNKQALKNALLSTTFQFVYTTLFGFHCAFLFIRSGSIVPPLFAHVFCNIMGVPQLQGELAYYKSHRQEIKCAYGLGVALYIFGMRYWTLNPDSTSLFWRASVDGGW